ncbi:MAG: sulfatase-like hydrolase/transferase [Planctomycetota bacterium]|jgi:arylsulfatase A-like enzyme
MSGGEAEVAADRGKSVHRDAYWKNRTFADPENDLDYPTPRCFEKAADFLEINKSEDNWHLHLEVFDPHEPFDCPQKYLDMYDDDWDRSLFTWPEYAKLDPELDDQKTIDHIRKCYAGTLSMTDAWLGKMLDKMDEYDMWKDTTLILTTDHGHLLGEHGFWAKNYMFDYSELAHIPMLMCTPDQNGKGKRIKSLTASMDIMPTLMELHGAELPGHVHGKSLLHLFDNDDKHHDAVLYGYFGKDVNVTDGKYTYTRQAEKDSITHHHTLMPRGFSDFTDREVLQKAETGVFLKNAHNIPHLRMECESRWCRDAEEGHLLYHIENDQSQENSLTDEEKEKEMIGKLVEQLKRCDAPDCQYVRLGLD